ncbi:MAG TPA: glycoside hydrolase family 16 protein [Acidisarcina sp.]
MNHAVRISNPLSMSARILLVLVCALFVGCRSQHAPLKATIEITAAPLASIGGPLEMESIEGRVRNAAPDQQIVLYARSGVWWIQPMTNQPFTKIRSDLTWKNSTHLGTEYAVLLVDSGYRPASKLVALPETGDGVAAIAIIKGRSGAPNAPSMIHFSGYDWAVRTADSDHGGEPNAYDPANAWTDEKGFLHLRMAQRNGRWSCAEVSLSRSLGYGTYRFVVQDSAHLNPSAVLGIFTWDDSRSQGFRNELDIELSRWGDPTGKNAQYVIQPFYAPENFSRFMVPSGVLVQQFRWQPGSVAFKTFRARSGSGPNLTNEHVFTSGIPTHSNETVHLDLYDFHHAESGSQQPAEVVIEKFEYVE